MAVEARQRREKVGHFSAAVFEPEEQVGFRRFQRHEPFLGGRDVLFARLHIRCRFDEAAAYLGDFLARILGLRLKRLLALDARVELVLQGFKRRRVGDFGPCGPGPRRGDGLHQQARKSERGYALRP
ncbi:hypothetical protein [Parvibaculum sp.]|uniref:hypothetical protein n=1 Tax=Parvibaculum sp. TaxID=2024848 RepID=UPI00320D6439